MTISRRKQPLKTLVSWRLTCVMSIITWNALDCYLFSKIHVKCHVARLLSLTHLEVFPLIWRFIIHLSKGSLSPKHHVTPCIPSDAFGADGSKPWTIRMPFAADTKAGNTIGFDWTSNKRWIPLWNIYMSTFIYNIDLHIHIYIYVYREKRKSMIYKKTHKTSNNAIQQRYLSDNLKDLRLWSSEKWMEFSDHRQTKTAALFLLLKLNSS